MRVPNLRVCKHLFHIRGGTRKVGKGEKTRPAVVPSSRRGKNLLLDARRKNQAARKGKWSPRGTVMTVLTFPGMRPGNRHGW